MKTYIAETTQEIQNPDLSKGYTYPGRIKVGTKDVVMEGSVETYPPNGLRRREDVYENCLFYVEGAPPEQQGQPSGYLGSGVTWDEMAAAYNEGVASVGQ